MTADVLPSRPVMMAGLVCLLALAAPAAMAQGVLTTHRIPAALANEAVGAAVAICASQGYAESAVVVDTDGISQAELRGDNTGVHTIENAHDKAYTAVAYKSDTGALVERAKAGPLSPALTRLPHLILSQGAILIKFGNEIIGGIGASGAPGGNLDEACARAGLDKIRDRLK
jgi:uncharacterized protein GlcG (DUF336 family)